MRVGVDEDLDRSPLPSTCGRAETHESDSHGFELDGSSSGLASSILDHLLEGQEAVSSAPRALGK